jgi:hypothetical protein
LDAIAQGFFGCALPGNGRLSRFFGATACCHALGLGAPVARFARCRTFTLLIFHPALGGPNAGLRDEERNQQK